MRESRINFRKTATLLKRAGYTVEVKASRNGVFFAKVTGRGIRGGFGEPSEDFYPQISGMATFDNVRSFNKWQDCPMVVKLPVADSRRLLKDLEHLASPEGYEISNTYGFLNHNPYQYDLEG